ncbi:MAG TPA: hypothetical protein VFC58_08130 [Desulfosporosinus sp.]|nr:hypothetical protein [Desulfosporosinus sp.]
MLPKKMELVVIKETSKQFSIVKSLMHRVDVDEPGQKKYNTSFLNRFFERGNFMEILKLTSLLFATVFAVSSIYGLKIGLPLLLSCLGLKES